MSYIEMYENYVDSLGKALQQIDRAQMEKFVKILYKACIEGRQIFMFGNGGSGATASHIACDLNKGCSYRKRKRFKVVCLNDNIPTMLAYANDVGYDDIFVEQLKNFMKPSDVVVGISGSGNSENVIRAIDYANKNDAVTVGLCGFSGGRLKERAKVAVHVEINDMQKVEDIHLILGHVAMQILSDERFDV